MHGSGTAKLRRQCKQAELRRHTCSNVGPHQCQGRQRHRILGQSTETRRPGYSGSPALLRGLVPILQHGKSPTGMTPPAGPPDRAHRADSRSQHADRQGALSHRPIATCTHGRNGAEMGNAIHASAVGYNRLCIPIEIHLRLPGRHPAHRAPPIHREHRAHRRGRRLHLLAAGASRARHTALV